jgi:hypothetical protein
LAARRGEGKVLAPTAGQVLSVPYTIGAVVLPGENIATIAEKNFILRLRVPERHASAWTRSLRADLMRVLVLRPTMTTCWPRPWNRQLGGWVVMRWKAGSALPEAFTGPPVYWHFVTPLTAQLCIRRDL